MPFLEGLKYQQNILGGMIDDFEDLLMEAEENISLADDINEREFHKKYFKILDNSHNLLNRAWMMVNEKIEEIEDQIEEKIFRPDEPDEGDEDSIMASLKTASQLVRLAIKRYNEGSK